MRSRLAAVLAAALLCLAVPASAQEVPGAEVVMRLQDPRILHLQCRQTRGEGERGEEPGHHQRGQ